MRALSAWLGVEAQEMCSVLVLTCATVSARALSVSPGEVTVTMRVSGRRGDACISPSPNVGVSSVIGPCVSEVRSGIVCQRGQSTDGSMCACDSDRHPPLHAPSTVHLSIASIYIYVYPLHRRYDTIPSS